MNTAELKLRTDAIIDALGGIDARFETVGKKILYLQELIDREVKNNAAEIYELRQRIRTLEVGR